MKKQLSILLILVILISSSTTEVMDAQQSNDEVDITKLEVSEEYWTRVYYTESVMVGYPEYYPLYIIIESKGDLPEDLQRETNYTNTVFIDVIDIQSNMSTAKFQEEGGIYRNAESHGKIGTERLEFKFSVTSGTVFDNSTAIRFDIRLTPYNMTGVLNNDLHHIDVELKRVGTGKDILKNFLLPVGIFSMVFIEIMTYKRLDRYFLENLKLGKYILRVYHFRFIGKKLKYNISYVKTMVGEIRLIKKFGKRFSKK